MFQLDFACAVALWKWKDRLADPKKKDIVWDEEF
jgi:hypothetical protein